MSIKRIYDKLYINRSIRRGQLCVFEQILIKELIYNEGKYSTGRKISKLLHCFNNDDV